MLFINKSLFKSNVTDMGFFIDVNYVKLTVFFVNFTDVLSV